MVAGFDFSSLNFICSFMYLAFSHEMENENEGWKNSLKFLAVFFLSVIFNRFLAPLKLSFFITPLLHLLSSSIIKLKVIFSSKYIKDDPSSGNSLTKHCLITYFPKEE